jgi:hypothetical protein
MQGSVNSTLQITTCGTGFMFVLTLSISNKPVRSSDHRISLLACNDVHVGTLTEWSEPMKSHQSLLYYAANSVRSVNQIPNLVSPER